MSTRRAVPSSPAKSQRRLRRVGRWLASAVRRHRSQDLAPSPQESAAAAGLRYSSDLQPGIRRTGAKARFTYIDARGKTVRDIQTLARIKALVLPPAWKDVWICTDPLGHLQATGTDARGRRQYRYHPLWRQVRDMTKYHRMLPFAEALPSIRARVAKDLASKGLAKDKVVATVVRLLDETHIRVGNEEYAKQNHSYGLTTMRGSHVDVHGGSVRFRFRGKSGKTHDVEVHDPRVARIVRTCTDLPGAEIFAYLDADGNAHDITSDDVNAYLHRIAGSAFTAKDFRTWAGTVHAALTLQGFPPRTTQAQTKKDIVRAIAQVASVLGNTPAVCRKCYVHPFILTSYADTSLQRELTKRMRKAKRSAVGGLSFGEAAVLALLRDCLDAGGHR